MSNADKIELEGTVVEALRGSIFKVKINGKEHIVECNIAGRLRMNNIRIIPGDKVDIVVSSADVTKGRIVWRYRYNKF